MYRRAFLWVLFATLTVAPRSTIHPQGTLTVQRIFGSAEFRTAIFPTVRWLRDGRSYLDVRAASGGGTELVRVDVVSGDATLLADAAALTTPDGERLEVEEVILSADETKALLFHSSVRVWRTNTRGVYHVYDFVSRTLRPLAATSPPRGPPSSVRQPDFLAHGLGSGAADPELQMFAAFSPDGRKVGFVRANNLWVTDLSTGTVTQLTTDGSDDVINGTTDWVYEEEFGLQDAFRWSPDGTHIAYWRFDQSAVHAFPMVDETSHYPTVAVLRYPKAGTANSRVTIGVVPATGGKTRWLSVGADTGVYYPRMEWSGPDSVVVTRLPRRQNRAELVVLHAMTGEGREMIVDADSAYVDIPSRGITWLGGGKEFLWLSDRSGWRQVWLHDRAGNRVRQVTTEGADVLDIVTVDEQRDMLYVTLAAPNPTQRQIFRFSIHGRKGAPRGGERVFASPGTHALNVSPSRSYAIDVHSALGRPPVMRLYQFPAMKLVRTVADNATLDANIEAEALRLPEFLRVPGAPGVMLDAYRIVPPDFNPSRRYPVLMYVYGGPAAPQVNDAWGGTRYLWHQMLAQHGYVVLVADNRGAAWRGRDFRKITQYKLGVLEAEDQIAVAKWVANQTWADPARIGMWGWSFGGYLTSMALVRGGSVFRMGMAVAPVTDWRLYDTIYTERFMWVPQENAEGYRVSAPQQHANGLTARLLLVHGTGDDNVHPQNTMQFADRLIAAGKRFDMVLYPNRTHSISGGNTTVHLYETLTQYLLANL